MTGTGDMIEIEGMTTAGADMTITGTEDTTATEMAATTREDKS
jgi:hypothetical protein